MRKIAIITMVILFTAFSFSIAYAHCGACGTLEDGTKGVVVTAVDEEADNTDHIHKHVIKCPECGAEIDIMKGMMKGSCPMAE